MRRNPGRGEPGRVQSSFSPILRGVAEDRELVVRLQKESNPVADLKGAVLVVVVCL